MSNEQRKASDILISLEAKVNSILQLISVYDLNSKLILNAVNNINKILVSADEEISKESSNEIINVSSDNIIVSQIPVLTQRTRSDTIVEEEEDDKPIVNKKQGKQIPVEQRIVDNKGKDLFMADVIISKEGKQIKKIKTSAVGKWQCHLQPGAYSVYISKTDATTMKKIDCTQEINVSDNIRSLTLPTAIINRS